MKTLYPLLIALLITACNSTTKQEQTGSEVADKIPVPEMRTFHAKSDTLFDFEKAISGELPENWSVYYTGRKGETPKWQVVQDKNNKVLAQMTSKNPNYHFNVAVYDKLQAKDMVLEVKLKGVSGHKDQGGGFVWRFTNSDNYYVVRANPLEDNVVLYKVVDGKRTDLPVLGKGRTYGVDVPALGKGWNKLKLIVSGNLFSVYLNGKPIFQVKDNSITTKGKVGLWTKADAVSYFDNFSVKVIE